MKKIDPKVEEKNIESFDYLGSRDEERVNEKDSNRKIQLRVKSNKEVFEMIQTHEILSESDCSEIEESKEEFATTVLTPYFVDERLKFACLIFTHFTDRLTNITGYIVSNVSIN